MIAPRVPAPCAQRRPVLCSAVQTPRLLRRVRPFSPQASRRLPLAKRGENPAQGCCLRARVRMVQCCSLIRHLPHLGAPGAVSLA